jgi:hypothetical protein
MLSQETLFTGSNLFILPFWLLMLLFPNWQITQRIMKSYLCFVPLCVLYLYQYIGILSPDFFQSLINPQLSTIGQFCTDHSLLGWVHFLAIDLFVGRWMYWEGQTTGIWTTHSLLLQFFAGPIGLLSHILTQWLTQKVSKNPEVYS